MKLQDFTGGASTRSRPQYLNVNEGVEYVNVDSRAGSLAPVQDKTILGTSVDKYHHYYTAKDMWVSSPNFREYLEYQKLLYSTDRVGTPTVFNGSTTRNISIAAPTSFAATVDSYPAPVTDVLMTPDNSGSGLPLAKLSYKIVNVDSGRASRVLDVTVASTGYIEATILSVGVDEVLDVESNVTVDSGVSDRSVTIANPVGVVIGSDGIAVYRLYNTVYHLVGTLLTDTSSLLDNVEDISANAVLDSSTYGPLSGTLQYALTSYNSQSGVESAPSQYTGELDLSLTGEVAFNSLPVSSDPQVDFKRLYRIGGDLSAMTMVTELPNASTVYTDDTKSSNVDGRLLTTIGNGAAPSSVQFLMSAYAMMFGAVGPYLRFTSVGEPHNWPALNAITYDADITGIAQVANGLLVFTGYKTHLVTGTGPETFSTQILSRNQGCISFESVQHAGSTVFWVSNEGVCASSGGTPTVLTQNKLGKLLLSPVSSALFNDVYYVHDADGTILTYDTTYKVLRVLDLGVVNLHVALNELWGWADGALYRLFSSAETISLHYLSPRFIEGSVTQTKAYKDVNVYSKGDVTVTIYIDDKQVAVKQITQEQKTIIPVPTPAQRGFFIQFKVVGTGEVYEIEYSVQ